MPDELSNMCPVHSTFIQICGGHKEVFTTLGWEVLKPDEPPLGAVLTPKAKDNAVRWSAQRQARKG